MTVYADLRRLITSGSVPARVRLSEASLAERLDVSRTPVREALARLDGDGLVRSRGRGVWVRVLDTDEVAATLEARAGLESWAVSLGASRVAAGEVPPARLAELDAIAAETDRLTREGDLENATAANRTFHEATAALAGNRVVDAVLERWWDQLLVATRAGLRVAVRIEQVNDEHAAIVRAVRAGDAESARRAVLDHIQGTTTSWEESR